MELILNKIKKFRDTVIYPSSLYFTIILFVFYIIGSSAASSNIKLTLKEISLLFSFSICLALCNIIFRINGMNMIIKIALHFTGTIFSFIILLVVMSGYFEKTSGGVLITIVVAVLYAIIAAAILGIRALIKRAENEKSEYTSKFDRKK